MSKMKKMVGILLTLIMVLAASMVVLAADSYTITIENDAAGYEYTAYQIFAGTLHETYSVYTGTEAPTDGTLLYTKSGNDYTLFTGTFNYGDEYYYVSSAVLSDITWGSGIDSGNSTLLSDLNNEYGTTDAAEIAKKLTTTADAKKFAEIVGSYLTTGTSSTETTGPYTVNVDKAGYYLIQNTKVPENGEYTSYILEVVTNVQVDPKTSDTTVDKMVGDVNDSTGSTGTDDSADYDIGDDVPFTLKATLPSNYADYMTYEMIFHDTLSSGLAFNDDVKVDVYTPTTGASIGTAWPTGSTYYTYDSTTGTFAEVDQTTVTAPVATDTYYAKYVVDKSCYTVATYGYSVADISDFNGNTTYSVGSGTTYYIFNGTTYEEVADSAEFNISTIYYTKGADCYHEASITDFDGNTNYSTSSGTTYYIKDNGNYKEVEDNAAFDATATYYVLADCSFEVQIADTNSLTYNSGTNLAVTSDSVILVTYTAKLLTTANYLETNEVYVEFSNNPYNSGTGNTEPSKTTVFTFTLTVNKVDESNNPLKGAGFTLYKEIKIASASDFDPNATAYYVITSGKFTAVDSAATYDPSATYYIAVGTEVKGTDMTSFVWNGLDDGNYVLVETTTPDGYNTMDNLYFTIEAEHTANGITSLTIKDAGGNVISSGTDASFTTSTSDGTISTKITNKEGSNLPSTGGIGTTIFYIVGGILVLGAVVVLITRRRMNRVNQ